MKIRGWGLISKHLRLVSSLREHLAFPGPEQREAGRDSWEAAAKYTRRSACGSSSERQVFR